MSEEVVSNSEIIAICYDCGKAIKSNDDDHTIYVSSGRSSTQKHVCTKCFLDRDRRKKEGERLERERQLRNIRLRRIHSLIWPSIVAIALLVIGIVLMVQGNKDNLGTVLLIASPLAFTFVADWILFNNPVPDVWVTIASWSVKFPGIIFSWSLDGFWFLICMKLLFAVLSVLISIAAVLFATSLGMVISVFVYPYALIKNLRDIE